MSSTTFFPFSLCIYSQDQAIIQAVLRLRKDRYRNNIGNLFPPNCVAATRGFKSMGMRVVTVLCFRGQGGEVSVPLRAPMARALWYCSEKYVRLNWVRQGTTMNSVLLRKQSSSTGYPSHAGSRLHFCLTGCRCLSSWRPHGMLHPPTPTHGDRLCCEMRNLSNRRPFSEESTESSVNEMRPL